MILVSVTKASSLHPVKVFLLHIGTINGRVAPLLHLHYRDGMEVSMYNTILWHHEHKYGSYVSHQGLLAGEGRLRSSLMSIEGLEGFLSQDVHSSTNTIHITFKSSQQACVASSHQSSVCLWFILCSFLI